MPKKNVIVFVACMLVLFGVWLALRTFLLPPPAPQRPSEAALARQGARQAKELVLEANEAAIPPARRGAEAAAALVRVAETQARIFREASERSVAESKAQPIVDIGSSDPASKYNLHVSLNPRGAGVLSVLLNKFQATDGMGHPDWEDKEKTKKKLLELVPKSANAVTASNLLYHFDAGKAGEDRPLERPIATLGQAEWKVIEEKRDVNLAGEGEPERKGYRVAFQTTAQGVEITKVFTLYEADYHLGLEVRLRRAKDAPEEVKFRYQLTGAKGLPIEGKWYTSTFRNALIGRSDGSGSITRDFQDSRTIGLKEGGEEVVREPNQLIRYAGVAVQYFASVIVVDKDQPKQDFLTRARPTLESGVVRGKLVSLSDDRTKLVLALNDSLEQTFYIDNPAVLDGLSPRKGERIAVLHYTDPQFRPAADNQPREMVYQLDLNADAVQPVWADDITVRVATEPLDLKGDAEVVHKYLLYNGPVKPRLLGYLGHGSLWTRPENPSAAVAPDVIQRYEDLGLNTLTDYHSPGVMGRISSSIGFTWLVIKCTNVMHWVLSYIHWVVPVYGLSIICLTVMVRGMMFPVSRKGAMTSIRMQQLAPELKQLQEKHKDDRQALQLAQWDLYRKNGVNPMGTCWFMFLQMPIFMGLYFALQESIAFRLAPFWLLPFRPFNWIENLAAPDMLIPWSDKIPFLSAPDSYGGFLYLGPYFNLLPVIAVTLMILQQKMITPPPTDEQQEMQQKMMKYMMVFFGLMFYKVASGLCLYFIASSLWGFAERKLLPKKKPVMPGGAPTATSSPGLLRRALGQPEGREVAGTGIQTADARLTSRAKQGRVKKRPERVPQPDDDEARSPLRRVRVWFRTRRERLSEWWAELLRQAAKK